MAKRRANSTNIERLTIFKNNMNKKKLNFFRKKQEVVNVIKDPLENFTSEQLIKEIYKRNDIYFKDWWSKSYIMNNTILTEQYAASFIKNENVCLDRDDLDNIVNEWLNESMNEVKSNIEIWIDNLMGGNGGNPQYFNFLIDRLKMNYEPSVGVYAIMDLSNNKKTNPNYEQDNKTLKGISKIISVNTEDMVVYFEKEIVNIIDVFFS